MADDQGVMRPRVRKTHVAIFEALPGEVPGLYEMGLPVVETQLWETPHAYATYRG